MPFATGADGAQLYFETHGDRADPAIFMGPHFYASRDVSEDCCTARWMRHLRRRFFLVLADYPRGIGRTPHDATACTPERIVQDCEVIADAAGIGRFGWLGYSFGGAVGIQMACRSQRVSALAVGGFPPLGAPFIRIIEMAQALARSPDVISRPTDMAMLKATVDFYTPLVSWPARAAIAGLTMPRFVFMGERDGMEHTGHSAPLAECLRSSEEVLRALGWQIVWMPGHDHVSALDSDDALADVVRFFCDALPRERR